MYYQLIFFLLQDDTIMVRKAGETGTDNLSRIQSVSSKHFEALGEEEEGESSRGVWVLVESQPPTFQRVSGGAGGEGYLHSELQVQHVRKL